MSTIILILFYVSVAVGVYNGINDYNKTASGSNQVPPIFMAITWPWILGIILVKLINDQDGINKNN